MSTTSIYNKDGRKMTLSEYFKTLDDKSGVFEIKSLKNNETWLCGTYRKLREHLRKDLWCICLQGIEIDEYGTTLLVR